MININMMMMMTMMMTVVVAMMGIAMGIAMGIIRWVSVLVVGCWSLLVMWLLVVWLLAYCITHGPSVSHRGLRHQWAAAAFDPNPLCGAEGPRAVPEAPA